MINSRIYLIGGAERTLGQLKDLYDIIDTIILQSNTKQILHVPFAKPLQDYQNTGWYKWFINRKEKYSYIDFLNARLNADLLNAEYPLIFINGGSDHIGLYNSINSNTLLKKTILNAKYLVAECSGSSVLGAFYRMSDNNPKLVKGLNIIKDTIIEPHYITRNRVGLLRKELLESDARIGIGLDNLTGIEFSKFEFPIKISRIGHGKIDIFKKLNDKILRLNI